MGCAERPHYLLFSESTETDEPGRWRFILRATEGNERIVADDIDPVARGERLELLTVVRGLEALQQPSRVTIWTASGYVREGIRYGLNEWRENGWCWEYFGRMVPVKNGDLWKRLDRAMQFHRVDCRTWRIDPAHGVAPIENQPSIGVDADRASEEQSGALQHLRDAFQPVKNMLKSICGHDSTKAAPSGNSADCVVY